MKRSSPSEQYKVALELTSQASAGYISHYSDYSLLAEDLSFGREQFCSTYTRSRTWTKGAALTWDLSSGQWQKHKRTEKLGVSLESIHCHQCPCTIGQRKSYDHDQNQGSRGKELHFPFSAMHYKSYIAKSIETGAQVGISEE